MANNDELKDLIIKLIRRVERLDARVSNSTTKPTKQTWVKVKTVQDVTGWNRQQLRGARVNKTIVYKKNETGIWYLLESIPEILLKKKVTI